MTRRLQRFIGFVAICWCSSIGSAQTITLVANAEVEVFIEEPWSIRHVTNSPIVTVEAGESARVLAFDASRKVRHSGEFLVPNESFALRTITQGQTFLHSHKTMFGRNADFGSHTGSGLPVVVGPATLQLIWLEDELDPHVGNAMCTIEIKKTTDSFVPSNVVVIPSDATGPVEIVLEASVDLINWQTAAPGTYGASTDSRFFRVRAIRREE